MVLLLSNSIGTVDQPYRGSVSAVFYHLLFWKKPYQVGDRIGQIHIEKVIPLSFRETDQLSETDRADGGFGSTGKN